MKTRPRERTHRPVGCRGSCADAQKDARPCDRTTRKDGVSGVLGAGIGVELASHFSLRVEWERYFVTRHSVDLASVGVRFGF
jgi:hypothetical protein